MVQILSVLIAILSIQLGASVAKQIFPIVGAIGATSLRLSLAALILTVIFRPWRQKLSRHDLRLIGLYGSALGVMNILFYQALARIPLGIAVALEFTGPLSVALATSRRALDFLWAGLAVAGIILILPFDLLGQTDLSGAVLSSGGADPLGAAGALAVVRSLDPVGVLYALGAGCGWAFYILFGQRIGTVLSGGRAVTLGTIVAALIALPLGLIQSGTALFNGSILPIALFVAIFSSALPYSLEMVALKRLSTQTFSIMMSLEPAIASLFGFLFLREALSLIQVFAIACIVIASAGSALTASGSRKAVEADSKSSPVQA